MNYKTCLPLPRDGICPERTPWNIWVLLDRLSLGMVTFVGSEATGWEIKAFRVEPVRIHALQGRDCPSSWQTLVWGHKSFPDHWPFVLFQTLCILANIADGTTAKELIMTNDDILQKIKYYMVGLCPLSLFFASCTLEGSDYSIVRPKQAMQRLSKEE